jgi:signal transduction histidine kinase
MQNGIRVDIRLHILGKTVGNEPRFRDFYLAEDVTRARIAILLFALPLVGFAFNDFMFFGLSPSFYGLCAIRAVLLLTSATTFVYVKKANSTTYDRLIVGTILATLVGGGIINATRPENFFFHSIITIISVFVVYLVLPLRFRYQSLLASIITAGEILILILLSSATGTVEFTLLFSMVVANIIAAMSSVQMHLYRKRTYDEFLKRKEAQDALGKHANRLSELVDERTKDLVEAQSRLLQTERLAAIGEMAGMVGHDLRSPLTGIKGSVYLLRKKHGAAIGESGNELLTTIDRAVDQSNNIVTDLLDYSREMNLSLEEYSPKSLVDNVLLSVNVPSEVKVLDHTQSFPSIWIDASKMERVFINLIRNAIEAMPKGGTLEIKSAQNQGNVEFTLADTGIGMPPDVQTKIFTPLFTTKTKGIGLGLPICKRIIEAHRGMITVQSEQNKGTIFTVTLPSEKPKDNIPKN